VLFRSIYKIKNLNLQKSEYTSKRTISLPFHEKLTNKDIISVINLTKKWNDGFRDF